MEQQEEEVQRLEREKAERLEEYVRLIRKFIDDGDLDAKKRAKRVLRSVQEIDAEIVRLMAYVSPKEL
jgi:hypothetical protein